MFRYKIIILKKVTSFIQENYNNKIESLFEYLYKVINLNLNTRKRECLLQLQIITNKEILHCVAKCYIPLRCLFDTENCLSHVSFKTYGRSTLYIIFTAYKFNAK